MINNYTCIILDDEPDAIVLLSILIKELFTNVVVSATFTSWKDALKLLRNEPPDILFLDIAMPEKNGIDLLKLLPDLKSELVFTTAYTTYAIDAFKFSATGYLLKPIDDEELVNTMNKCIERIKYKRMATQNNVKNNLYLNSKIGIPDSSGITYVGINDIIYFESYMKCTKVITNKSQIVSSYNIGKFKSLIADYLFYQVHRSFIVNLNCIIRYESAGSVIMSNNQEIPVSRNLKEDFLKLFATVKNTGLKSEDE